METSKDLISPINSGISHDKGFRLVKSEETFTVENPTEWSSFKAGVTYIRTRKIDYHEYIPGVWFPKRIESSTAQKASSEQQGGENVIYKDVPSHEAVSGKYRCH